MKSQNILSFIVSFIMLFALACFIYYMKNQEKLLTEKHDSTMKELREMKAEAQKLNSELNSQESKTITEEEREQASKDIQECLDNGTCLFQLRGAATKHPTMSFIVLRDNWYSFEDSNIDVIRQMLKEKVNEASINPEYYITIPSNAPFYPIALQNARNTKSYSVILSNSLSPQGKLYIDETILKNF